MAYYDNPVFPTDNSEYIGWVIKAEVVDGQILYRVRIPALHGKNVKDEDLPRIPAEYPPGLHGATTSFGAIDVGQLVRIRKDGGQGGSGLGSIRSVYQTIVRSSNANQADRDISKELGDVYKEITRQVRSADLQKILNDQGVEVVKLIEKELFKVADVKGIISHAALPQLNGVIIPQLKQISTALDSFSAVITSDMLSKMPGTNFSIGNLLNLMPDVLKKELFKALPDNVGTALNAVMTLMPKFDGGSFGGAVTGTRVNLEVFMPKAVELLKEVQDISGMFSVLNKLMTDTSLFGLDALGDLFEDVTGAFGGMQMKFGIDGSISLLPTEEMTKALSAFTSAMGDFKSAEGQLFDTVNDLAGKLQRLQPELNTQMNTMLDDIKSATSHSELKKFI